MNSPRTEIDVTSTYFFLISVTQIAWCTICPADQQEGVSCSHSTADDLVPSILCFISFPYWEVLSRVLYTYSCCHIFKILESATKLNTTPFGIKWYIWRYLSRLLQENSELKTERQRTSLFFSVKTTTWGVWFLLLISALEIHKKRKAGKPLPTVFMWEKADGGKNHRSGFGSLGVCSQAPALEAGALRQYLSKAS